jgi:hypothetical protein
MYVVLWYTTKGADAIAAFSTEEGVIDYMKNYPLPPVPKWDNAMLGWRNVPLDDPVAAYNKIVPPRYKR